MSARNDRAATGKRFQHRLIDDWYRPRRTLLTLTLTPLSWLFGTAAAARRALYRMRILASTRLPVPVIVVGNITVGGTGKTPLVIALVDALRRHGHRPGIVSRGYAGRAMSTSARYAGEAASTSARHAGSAASTSARRVQAGDDPDVVGDEPLLLAQTGAPVFVGRDRVAAGRALLAAHPDVSVIVSDDGLQHYALQRDCEIVVIDGERGFGNRALLPAGPLRERPQRLERADAIVVNGDDALDMPTRIPSFHMALVGDTFVRLVDKAAVSADAFRGLRVHALAGIGHPGRFFATLRKLGIEGVMHPFPDHHRYTAQDVALPDADAIVMTAKDAIKCRRMADVRMWSLPVAAHVDEALFACVIGKIGSSGRLDAGR